MKIERFIQSAKEKHGLSSNAALGEMLGVRGNTISQWCSGARTIEHEQCLKLALLLELDDPLPVIMAADMDRAERAGQHSLWEVFSARMAKAATPATLAIVAAGVTNFVTPSTAQATAHAVLRSARFILC